MNQVGGSAGETFAIVMSFFIIIILLAVIGYFVYLTFIKPKTCVQPVNCSAINSNYRPYIPYTSWTSDDRNTAIALLNYRNPNLDIASLSSITPAYNKLLAELLTIYCQ